MTQWCRGKRLVFGLVLGFLAACGSGELCAGTSSTLSTATSETPRAQPGEAAGRLRLGERIRAAFGGGGSGASGRNLPPELELIRDVEYGEGGGRALALDILRRTDRASTSPAIVFIHGGGWRGGSKDRMPPLLIRLAESGYFCVSIEYRLTDEAIFPAQIEDCKCAIRWLRAHASEYRLSDRIGVWGISAGGHLAALLGTSGDVPALEGSGGWSGYSSRVQAVVNSCGPTDLLKVYDGVGKMAGSGRMPRGRGLESVALLLGGDILEKRAEAAAASPITYVSGDDAPCFFVHGAKDFLVPVAQSEVLDAALRKAGVPSGLKILPEGGHGASSPETELLTVGFFSRHLDGP